MPSQVSMSSSWISPEAREFSGRFVLLRPSDAERDAPALFAASHGSPEKEAVWNHLPYGPFASAGDFCAHYRDSLGGRTDLLLWTAFRADGGDPVGTTALAAIVPEHGRAEIGHVWFSPAVQKSPMNTETQYLLLRHLFDDLRYRRVEWKCDSLNHASRTTAQRMGFVFEGRFRQHMRVRGRNRDTDWFAMTDKDWPSRKANFERWLYSGEKVSLFELNNG